MSIEYADARGISPAVQKAAGLRILSAYEMERECGIRARAMEMPYYDKSGKRTRHARYKIFDKEATSDGRKFHQRPGTSVEVYIPPLPKALKLEWSEVFGDEEIDLTISEGEMRALAAVQRGILCVAIPGVTCWEPHGEPLEIWSQIQWKNRHVEIVFDSDAAKHATKPQIRRSELGLADYLRSLGADVFIRDLFDAAGTGCTGLDDFLHLHGAEAYRTLAPCYRLDSSIVDGWRKEVCKTHAHTLPQFDLEPVPLLWIDKALPPLQFTLENRIVRRTVTVVTAEGGTGKTTLLLQLCESIASGLDFCGIPTKEGVALFLGFEDPEDVSRRRLHRIFQDRLASLGLRDQKAYRAAVAKNLLVKSIVGKAIRLVTSDHGVGSITPVVDQLIARIASWHLRPALIVLDPISRLHNGVENDPTLGTMLVEVGESIANAFDCTVILTAHTGKSRANDDSMYASRGTSALPDAARCVLRLRKLDVTETAKLIGLTDDERLRGVTKLIHAKSNYSALAPDVWLKRDDVGSFVPFTPHLKPATSNYDEFIRMLRCWALLRGANTTFTKRNVEDNLQKIFDGTVSQKRAREFLCQALKVGDVEETMHKIKGGRLLRIAERPG